MSRTLLRVTGALAVLALAAPAVAGAHPGIYQVTAKVAKTAARQTLTIDATGGTFKPSAGASAVAFNATAAQVQSALQADPAIGFDNIAVTGSAGGPYALTFIGTKAGVAVAQLVPDASGLTGGASTATASVNDPGGTAVTYASDPTGATMADQVQYIVSSDGYILGFTETNGVAGGGVMNLKKLPTAYRASMTSAQKLAYPAAQTGIQLHATCSGVAALSDPANILAFDLAGRTDGDPFYDYLPWQSTSAGFGDDPSHWIGAVKTATNGLPGAPAGGVDLSTLSTVADFTNTCTALGGTYHPADTSSKVATAAIADAVTAAVAPLNTQIGAFGMQVSSLTSQISALTTDKATLTAANTQLTTDNATPAAANKALQAGTSVHRALALTLASSHVAKQSNAMVTGTAGQVTTIREQVSAAVASALHLKSRTIATATKKLSDQGALLVTLSIAKSTTKALTKKQGSIPITVTAVSGTEQRSATATFAG
jgi:hypothetical protein